METKDIFLPIISLVSGLLGVYVGARLSASNERAKRQLEFIDKQLRDFYSPLLGIRKVVRSYGETRVRVQGATNAAWRELSDAASVGGPPALQELRASRWPEFERTIHYDNEQFEQHLMPYYDQMLKIFRDNYMFAEASTRQHLPLLIDYVELWHRHLDRSIPVEAVAKLKVTEEKLLPFYDNLESTFATLRDALAAGDPRSIRPTSTDPLLQSLRNLLSRATKLMRFP